MIITPRYLASCILNLYITIILTAAVLNGRISLIPRPLPAFNDASLKAGSGLRMRLWTNQIAQKDVYESHILYHGCKFRPIKVQVIYKLFVD